MLLRILSQSFFLLLLLQALPCFAEDFFRSQVAPILQRRCLSCHNSDDRKGQFSLQTRDELNSSGMVDPENPDSSLLIAEITSSDGKPASMPKDGKSLTNDEVTVLRQWVRDGAAWPDAFQLTEAVVDDFQWWSFQPLQDPEVPAFEDARAREWIRNPVDAFILRGLRTQGLSPSPEADRRTLIRRVTFDLLGLPPTPAEVDAFVKDEDPDAWDKLVERLLASPHYGERWARHWLDVVRYADTCGYDKDKLRPNAWPYRDYVIRSFNTDKPYARFVREQVAGDVLYPGDPDGILGLGFLAAGPWDFIGHVEVPESKIDGKVARNLDRDDMASGTLNTFCSLTIQCARCHNHKFDPFTQQHYYGLQSVFAAVDRAERPYDTDPETERKRADLVATRANALAESERLEAEIRSDGGENLAGLDKKLAELKPLAGVAPKRPEYGYHSDIAARQDTTKWVEVDLGSVQEITSVSLHPCHDEFGGIGAGFGFPIRFQIALAASVDKDQKPSDYQVVLDETSTDFPNPGLTPVSCSVTHSARFVRVTATRLATRSNDFIFSLAEVTVLNSEGRNLAAAATITALDSIEAPERWRKTNLTDGIWPAPLNADAEKQLAEVSKTHAALMQTLVTPERQAKRTQLQAVIENVDRELAALPTGRMVYAAATHFPAQGNFIPTQGKPRVVRLLHRGNETQPRDEVTPGTVPLSAADVPTFPLTAEHSEADRRAALAEWITRPEHPTTWRSIVNRVWQYHFGRAIVDSPNDFGRMGQLPVHPELLDWLASDFLRQGQSFKTLHRLIVTSSTYRQSSAENVESALKDSDNQFLWRMHRRRLTAEEIRDAVLMVSGKLNPEMGGPGFYLFELEKTDHSPHYEYHKFNPEDTRSHRRSVYRFIVRSQPDPFMTTLDCADSSQSTPRRHETLTALQALSLLNNPFNLTMARHFSERLQKETMSTDEQLNLAWKLLTGREPESSELSSLKTYAEQHGLPALCRLLLNLNEFVFVD
ncbi:MAG: PSD1 and planctomycete cytochrome C domain-containing protein [Planctomycetia bacterium]